MIILVPPSEGKNKIKRPLEVKFKNTDFNLMEDVEQVIRLLDYWVVKQNPKPNNPITWTKPNFN